MEFKIIWSPRAVFYLEEICKYIAKDSPVYAVAFAGKVLSLVKNLSQYPQSGRVVPEYNDQNLRELIYQNYRIVYRVRNNAVEVAAVCHGARKIESMVV